MAFLNIITDVQGLIGVKPRIVYIQCDNSYSQVTASNFLKPAEAQGYHFEPTDEFHILYGTDADTLGVFIPTITSTSITLSPYIGEGNVTTPVVSGNFPKFSGTTGLMIDSGISPSDATKTKAAMVNGATVVGDLAGFSDILGTVVDVPNAVTDYQQFVGLTNILINSVGTWTRTRVAEANYSLVHTPANDTSVIGIDITPQLRAAASHGFKLASIDVIYSIATLALDAHTFTLDAVSYANNVAVAVASAGAGSLSTATQANPYVTNVTPATPAFLNTACAKYVFEITVDAAATGLYSFYGLNLHFTKTIN